MYYTFLKSCFKQLFLEPKRWHRNFLKIYAIYKSLVTRECETRPYTLPTKTSSVLGTWIQDKSKEFNFKAFSLFPLPASHFLLAFCRLLFSSSPFYCIKFLTFFHHAGLKSPCFPPSNLFMQSPKYTLISCILVCLLHHSACSPHLLPCQFYLCIKKSTRVRS